MSMIAPDPQKGNSIVNKVIAWFEVAIMTRLVPQGRPGGLWRWIFKMPVLSYKLGLGWTLGNHILLLVTRGRKSGKTRKTPLEYHLDPQTQTYFLMAGWGGKTDWYRNVCANPQVQLHVGRERFEAVAEIASEEIVARRLMEAAEINPRAVKMFQRWCDRPIDGSFESYLYAARFFPSVLVTKK